MAKRWVIGGLAVGVGALVLAPEARTWLRRRLGLEPEDRRWFEEEGVEAAEHEGDEPLDTREARYSLRARLAEEGHAEPVEPAAPAPEPSAFPAFPPPAAAPSFPAFEQPAVAPEPAAEEPEPVAEEPEPEPETAPPSPWASAPEPEPEPETAPPSPWASAPEPEPEPETAPPSPWASAPEPEPETAPPSPWASAPEPEPESETAQPSAWAPEPAADPAPSFETPVPEPDPGYISYDALPAITPEADAPAAPGEDTNEIEPLGTPDESDEPAAEANEDEAEDDDAPPPPPTMLRPPGNLPGARPFGESASFRSAIDAARERVHGAAREAAAGDGEGSEPDDDRSQA